MPSAYQNPIGVLVRHSVSVTEDGPQRASRRASVMPWIRSRSSQRFNPRDNVQFRDLATSGDGSFVAKMSKRPLNDGSEDLVTPQNQFGVRPVTDVSISSYYGMARNSNLLDSIKANVAGRDTDSPVYGLNGIAHGKPRRPRSETSIDELFRQQNELDQSIAALKLIAPHGNDGSPEFPVITLTEDQPSRILEDVRRRSDRLSSHAIGHKHESESNRSDFSLSVFPEPPSMAQNAKNVILREPEASATSFSTQRSSNYMGRYNPNARFGSTGTQYDVTSFIGGLTMGSRGTLLLSAAAPSSGTSLPGGGIAEETTPEGEARSRRESSSLLSRPVLRPVEVKGRLISAPRDLSLEETAPGAFEQPRRPPVVLIT